jgi:hypothetical protein
MSTFQILLCACLLLILVQGVVNFWTWIYEGLDQLRMARRPAPTILTCIGCGCTEHEKCTDDDQKPCHWLATDASDNTGVCSKCGAFLPTFMESGPAREAMLQ